MIAICPRRTAGTGDGGEGGNCGGDGSSDSDVAHYVRARQPSTRYEGRVLRERWLDENTTGGEKEEGEGATGISSTPAEPGRAAGRTRCGGRIGRR